MIIVEIIHTCAIEIYHMQRKYWYCYYNSKSERNEEVVVMQIKFTEIKYEINRSQRLKKNYWWYNVQFHGISLQLDWIMMWLIKVFYFAFFFFVENSQNTNSSAPK